MKTKIAWWILWMILGCVCLFMLVFCGYGIVLLLTVKHGWVWILFIISMIAAWWAILQIGNPPEAADDGEKG